MVHWAPVRAAPVVASVPVKRLSPAPMPVAVAAHGPMAAFFCFPRRPGRVVTTGWWHMQHRRLASSRHQCTRHPGSLNIKWPGVGPGTGGGGILIRCQQSTRHPGWVMCHRSASDSELICGEYSGDSPIHRVHTIHVLSIYVDHYWRFCDLLIINDIF